jgi:uncharacterized small protein (DUF1192 family)
MITTELGTIVRWRIGITNAFNAGNCGLYNMKNDAEGIRQQTVDVNRVKPLDVRIADLDARIERNRAELERNNATIQEKIAELLNRIAPPEKL